MSLPSSMADFVPRDRQLQKAYYTFSISIYRKKTFTGLYTKWDSFTPGKHKINVIRRTITFRCFSICSSPSILRSCLNELRKLLLKNGYPAGVVNYNINDVLNRQEDKPKNPATTVPKKETILVLPYLGVQSKIVIQRLRSASIYSMAELRWLNTVFKCLCLVHHYV